MLFRTRLVSLPQSLRNALRKPSVRVLGPITDPLLRRLEVLCKAFGRGSLDATQSLVDRCRGVVDRGQCGCVESAQEPVQLVLQVQRKLWHHFVKHSPPGSDQPPQRQIRQFLVEVVSAKHPVSAADGLVRVIPHDRVPPTDRPRELLLASGKGIRYVVISEVDVCGGGRGGMIHVRILAAITTSMACLRFCPNWARCFCHACTGQSRLTDIVLRQKEGYVRLSDCHQPV